uniref:Serine hydrolase like n=1 Tax=Cyclopterus lumpus TaxID=8103 RepID=A0A8C2WIR6_CYCLU
MRPVGSDLSVPVPWGHIRGKVWGPEHGRPVLCLHGWADNCGTFNTLIPLLPKECRYVALDLSGHGLSSHLPPGESYSCPAYVADVWRVADALQLRTFSIVGHSMGECGFTFSALYPEMVDALVLLDSYGFLPTDSVLMRQGMDEMLQFEKKTNDEKRVYTHEKAVERLSAANPTMTEHSVRVLLERGLVQVEGGAVCVFYFVRSQKNPWRMSLEQSLEMQSRVRASVLLVLVIDSVCLKLPLCLCWLQHTVVTVPGDHHVHLNEPEVVAPIVSDFLRNRARSQSNHGQHKL